MSDDSRRRELVYERLYRRWEESNWSATAIDFGPDAADWNARLDDRQREAALWNYAMFLRGVEGVGRALASILAAAPAPAPALFISTQIADEARNRVFLDRFMREVAGQGHDPASTSDAMERHLTWGFKQLFSKLQDDAESLLRKPGDRALLAGVVAVCHVVVEGVLAIPGQHFIHRYVREKEIMPGFADGLERIARDEERHVAFGMTFLGRLMSSAEARAAAIAAWNRVLPWMVGVFVPPNVDRSYVECFDFTLEEIYGYGLQALETKLAELEVDPSELRLLSLDDRTLSYEDRAKRLVTLVETGVIGDDRRDPEPTQQTLEILFDAMARAVDVDVARSLGGPVEWAFTDAEPWHLVVTDDHAEAKLGRAGNPSLRLEISASEWAKIAIGRGDARWALLKRRMRVHGHWQAKAKLSNLFL